MAISYSKEAGSDTHADLKRAQDLYVELFGTYKPLSSLGYTMEQIDYVRSALKLLEGKGKMCKMKRSPPRLSFLGGDQETINDLHIVRYPKWQGFHLIAHKDSSEKRIAVSLAQGEIAFEMDDPPVTVFGDDSDCTMVNIALFPAETDFNNIPLIINEMFFDLMSKEIECESESFFSNLKRYLLLVATCKAFWIDEEKLVASLHLPLHDPLYLAYKKLPPVSHKEAEMIPLGRMANVCRNEIRNVLSCKK